MKKSYLPIFSVLFAVAAVGADVDSPVNQPGSVASLEALVEQYVGLRSEIAAEKRKWKEQQEQWQREISLLETEKRILSEELQKIDNVSTVSDKAQRDLAAEQKDLQKAQADMSRPLETAERNAVSIAAYIPSSLMPGLQKSFAAVSQNVENRGKAGVIRRLQVVTAFYTGLEQLQNNIHVVKELLDPGGGSRREMDVMYIGLARAFAVDARSDIAAVGVPGRAGWIWTVDNSRAAEIRKAISIFNRQIPAELVTLPMQVQKETANAQ